MNVYQEKWGTVGERRKIGQVEIEGQERGDAGKEEEGRVIGAREGSRCLSGEKQWKTSIIFTAGSHVIESFKNTDTELNQSKVARGGGGEGEAKTRR